MKTLYLACCLLALTGQAFSLRCYQCDSSSLVERQKNGRDCESGDPGTLAKFAVDCSQVPMTMTVQSLGGYKTCAKEVGITSGLVFGVVRKCQVADAYKVGKYSERVCPAGDPQAGRDSSKPGVACVCTGDLCNAANGRYTGGPTAALFSIAVLVGRFLF